MLEKFQKILNKVVGYFYTPPVIFQDSNLMRVLGDMENEEEKKNVDLLEINKAKRKIFERALESGIATLQLDARVSGVQVPQMFKGNSSLALNYSYKYNVPDFCFDDDCVVATLSFSRVPFRCIIPWESVSVIIDHSSSAVYQFVSNTPHLSQEKNEQKEKKSFQVIEGSQEDYSDIQEEKPRPKLTLIRGGKDS